MIDFFLFVLLCGDCVAAEQHKKVSAEGLRPSTPPGRKFGLWPSTPSGRKRKPTAFHASRRKAKPTAFHAFRQEVRPAAFHTSRRKAKANSLPRLPAESTACGRHTFRRKARAYSPPNLSVRRALGTPAKVVALVERLEERIGGRHAVFHTTRLTRAGGTPTVDVSTTGLLIMASGGMGLGKRTPRVSVWNVCGIRFGTPARDVRPHDPFPRRLVC